MNDIRDWYIQISQNVKLSYYLKKFNIKNFNFSLFIKDYDKAIKEDKLLMLKEFIINDLHEKIE